MSDTSPNLSLPYLMPSQAQKHVTHNEALQMLDALVQLRIEAFEENSPPASPATGVCYSLGASPTGDWAGHAGELAMRAEGSWSFVVPHQGWRAYGIADGTLRIWDGGSRVLLNAQTQNLAMVGIDTTADTSNRLAVSSSAALFTHAGQGHQVKVNKASAADTAALLFQSGWTGHAEVGLLGDNDFSVKVSDDGGLWHQALTMKADTGRAGFGTTSPDAHLEVEGGATTVLALTATGSGQDFLQAGDGSTMAFRLDDSGNGSCAGAWTGGGADYAEYFEWGDGNPQGEDRRGVSVVVCDGKLWHAQQGEDPIGVISAAPCVLGNDDLGEWQGKYLRDPYGARRLGTNGKPMQNPAFDPSLTYLPRKDRDEWGQVGLIGRLRLQAGQPVSTRWVKLQVLPGGLEEWLVR